jgi:diguanylate cyclase (GGDEF)-like protein
MRWFSPGFIMDDHDSTVGNAAQGETHAKSPNALRPQSFDVDPRAVLSSIGEVVYDWDIATDQLSWSGNVQSVFGITDTARLSQGRSFDLTLDPTSPSTRSETILLSDSRDQGSGVAYRFAFSIKTPTGSVIWFEDTGRWFAGADGSATSAHGVVRRIEAPADNDRNHAQAKTRDELTGGYLRSPFLRIMDTAIAEADQKKKSSAFLLASINDLAFVNQTYGFAAADEVIAGVAQRMRAAIRGKDKLVRASGTKLGALLTPFDAENINEAAERIAQSVAEHPIKTSAGPVAVSLHLGAVIAPQHGRTAIDLMRKAEEALSEARMPGNPDFVAYKTDDSRDSARRRNFAVSEDVLRALNDRRIVIAYEPVISSATHAVQFHEVLVRVQAEDGSLMGAAAIIPPAERFGLVKYVDARVLELAVERLNVQPSERLSVNVSMRTALTHDWITGLEAHLAASPAVADRLIIEITETAAMSDIDTTARVVARIKELGARVAIDDFGSGHTSFKSLRQLPVDLLKIDGVFIQNLARSTDDRFFVRTLVDLARNLGVQTVAEWVQDDESARLLAEWGVDFLQGEFCGHAAPEALPLGHVPLRKAS